MAARSRVLPCTSFVEAVRSLGSMRSHTCHSRHLPQRRGSGVTHSPPCPAASYLLLLFVFDLCLLLVARRVDLRFPRSGLRFFRIAEHIALRRCLRLSHSFLVRHGCPPVA